MLEKQRRELEVGFTAAVPSSVKRQLKELEGNPVLVLCCNGNTSRIATSILRAQGVFAFIKNRWNFL